MGEKPMGLILREFVLISERRLGLLILMGEIVLPPGAEVDVPSPEPADKRLGILVILRPQRAVFAGVL